MSQVSADWKRGGQAGLLCGLPARKRDKVLLACIACSHVVRVTACRCPASSPRVRPRRSDREPGNDGRADAFALLRLCAGDRDRPAGVACPGPVMAAAGMPDRPRQVLAPAVAASRNVSTATCRRRPARPRRRARPPSNATSGRSHPHCARSRRCAPSLAPACPAPHLGR